MTSIKIPTPLRPYTANQSEVTVTGTTVGEALADLVAQFPDLRPHLFNGAELRDFVNVFLGEEDIRFLYGVDTPLDPNARLRIVPAIAGGKNEDSIGSERNVDHSALRINQVFIIGLLVLAFVLDAPALAAFVAAVMLIGAARPGAELFKLVYWGILRPAGIVRPDVIPDNPEPHRFAQGLGGIFAGLGALALFAGASAIGWALTWLVVALASLNLFFGWCAGCNVYYLLNRLGAPGFNRQRVKARQ
jgi:molybdopterin converting factor small subunit